MPEENGNGTNGKQVGLLDKVKTGIKEDVQSIKTDLPAKAKEQIEAAAKFAIESPYPASEEMYQDIFA